MADTVFLKDNKLNSVTALDNAFIKSFLPSAPELALKAYIYGLMLLTGGASADADIASALGCADTDIRAAFSYWQSVGLVTVVGEEPLQIKYNSVADAIAFAGTGVASGARYAAFVGSLQRVLGTRQLSGSELTKIYDWLDVFGFEEDAAVRIVSYCLDKKGARTSVAYMDQMAKRLAADGAVTLEQVNEAISNEQLMSSGAGLLLKRWHQKRPPTEDELALYEKWTKGWGFDEYAIDYACTKLTSAANPSFGYVDSILADWHRDGKVGEEKIKEMQKLDDSIREITRQALKRAGIKSSSNGEQRLCVKEWTVDNCMSPELIYLAAELSQSSVHRFQNMRRLLDEWHAKGISSITAAKSYYEAYQKNAPAASGGKKNKALNYKQGGAYTKEELKKLGISLGEEFYSDD